MNKRYGAFLLACLFALTLWAGAYDAPRLGEPPQGPDFYEEEARLLDGAAVRAASGTNLQSGDKALSKLSRQGIGNLLSENPLTLPDELYDEAPSVKAPYAPGKLKQEALQATLNRLNALRRIAGLNPVALDAALCENAQYGAVLLAASNFGHSPKRPADMDDDFYQKGLEAASSSNIAWGYGLTGAADGFMDDSDASNIDRLGHRRWQLNPTMGKVGFGYADNRMTEKVFDRSASGGDYDFVAWPASGYFPSRMLDINQAWSVSLNQDRYAVPVQSDLTVTLRRDADNTTWTFSGAESYTAADSGPYFHVNTGNFGIPNCIVFRPDGVKAYDGSYTVSVAGLKDKSGADIGQFSYRVTFFDAADYSVPVVTAAEASPWNTLHVTSDYADAATLAKLSALLPRTVTVSAEDGRTFDAAVKGGWTLDRANRRWTASVDPASLSGGFADPKGLLNAVSVSYATDAQTGSLSVTLDPGRFRIWRQIIGMDVVELHHVTASGGVKRFDSASDNYKVDAQGYCVFTVDAWTAADSGDWYALYYNATNPNLKDAYLAGGQNMEIGVSLSAASIVNRKVSVTVNGDPGADALLYFAAFDQKGKFISAVVQTVSAAGSYEAVANPSGAARVSIFLTGADGRPLCNPKTI